MRRVLKFGQRYSGKGHISDYADYIQFNICGLSPIDVIQRYFLYDIDKPIVLLGDYTHEERNSSEDDMLSVDRIYDIKETIRSLKAFGADIWGITLHPVSRSGLESFGAVSFKEYIDKLTTIYDVPVMVKNRQYGELFLSNPEEIIEFSQTNKLTLDSSFLFEVCGNDKECYIETVSRINISNVQEIHVKHLSTGRRGLPKENDLDEFEKLASVIRLLKDVPWATFVQRDGVNHNMFDDTVKRILDILSSDGSK